MLEPADCESAWLRSPGFADEFIGGEAFEGFESSGEVVGVEEVLQVGSQLVVSFVEVAIDGRVLDGAVHSFDLPIGPWVLGLGQPVVDGVLGAGVFEGVRPNGLSSLKSGLDVRRRRARIAWGGEVGSVVGEDGMDLVGDGGDQAAQEVSGSLARPLLVHLDEGELRRSVDGDDEVELALRGSNLGDVDMEIADRIGLEFAFGGGFAFDLRQPGDPMALQTPVKATSASDAGWWAAGGVVDFPTDGACMGICLSSHRTS